MALVDNAWYVNYGDGSTTGYYAVTAWAALATKVCGNIVRQLAAPAVGSERIFVCVNSTGGTGATGASEPTWVITRGGKTTDSTVTWQEATGVAALNGDLSANTPNWTIVKNTAVTLGQVIQNNAGNLILICTTAGTAGNGAEPSWAAFTNTGATTADNTVTWTTLGASFTAYAAPHARVQNAYVGTWGQAGNTFFVGDNHAETRSTALTMTSPGTVGSPCFVYCADKTKSPPTSSDLKTTATISTTGGTNLTIGGFTYFYGIGWFCGTGVVTPNFTLNNDLRFDTCSINAGASATLFLLPGAGLWDMTNCTLGFGTTGGQVRPQGIIRWKNSPAALTGTAPTTLYSAFSASTAFFDGVDLSALTGILVSGSTANAVQWTLRNCKLGAGVTLFSSGTSPLQSVQNIVCDSSGTNYRQQISGYLGDLTQETTIIRTGGATDGTTPISWKIASASVVKWLIPFISFPMTIWNDSTSAITSLTIYGTTTGGGVPNNDDIWVEVEYLGSASTPQGSFIASTKANNLAASVTTNNSSDGSTWGGGGAGNGFKIVVPSFTPGMKGPINITVKVAKPSSTYYIDPRPSISGITVSKSEILAPGVYSNELSSGGGSAGMLFIPNMAGT